MLGDSMNDIKGGVSLQKVGTHVNLPELERLQLEGQDQDESLSPTTPPDASPVQGEQG